MKKILKWLAISLVSIVLLVVTVPLFIKPAPLTDTLPVSELAKADSRFIDVPAAPNSQATTRLHYTIEPANNPNQSTTFVLLHGSVLNLYSWQPITEPLAELGTVIAYDQVPYGLSDKSLPSSVAASEFYSLDASVSRLIALLDQLDAQNVVLVANSFGGVIAAQALAQAPERFDAVLFIDAAIYVEEQLPTWLTYSPQMQNLGPYFARMLGYNEAFYQSMFANPENITETMVENAKLNTAENNWDKALWAYLQNWQYDTKALQASLENINKPALVISGELDQIVPLAQSQRIASKLPNSQLLTLANCGHLPQLECPEALVQSIQQWFANTEISQLMPPTQ